MDKNIIVSLNYSEELWNYLEESADCEGRLAIDQEDFEAILVPRQVAGFISVQDLISISTNLLTPFAISLFANWVYDLIKTKNAEINSINGKRIDPKRIDKLEIIMEEAISTKKEKPLSKK